MASTVPTIGFHISVGLAVIVGSLALFTGASPLNALIKAGVALLAFGTVSWLLSMALVIAHLKGMPASQPSPGDKISRQNEVEAG